MSELVTRAQITLLARQLHVPEERVAHLERLGAAKLKDLREAMSHVMFDDNADVFRRVSMLVPIVPLPVVMPIVQRVCPPEMAGRAAGAIAVAHPKKSVSALTLVKPDYGASAAPFVDPRAVDKIAHLAPHPPVVAIAKELLSRRDYFTGGLFVDAATEDLIKSVEAGIDDDEGLIRTGAYVYSAKVLSNIIRVIIEASPDRIKRLVATSANGPTDLRLASLSVLSQNRTRPHRDRR